MGNLDPRTAHEITHRLLCLDDAAGLEFVKRQHDGTPRKARTDTPGVDGRNPVSDLILAVQDILFNGMDDLFITFFP